MLFMREKKVERFVIVGATSVAICRRETERKELQLKRTELMETGHNPQITPATHSVALAGK